MALMGMMAACAPEGPCNGSEALCDRAFNEVAFPATHNSMSNADDGWMPPNQQHGLQRQLDDGIRAFLVDSFRWEEDLYLCHVTCDLGRILLDDALEIFSRFIADHPREVITFIIQDGISGEETEAAFTGAGLASKAYAHSGGPWPTLLQLIDAQTTLVVSAETTGPPPDWYHYMWEIAFDTNYAHDSVEAFECDLNRGEAGNDLFLLNHWLGPFPTEERGAEANAKGVLSGRAEICWQERDHIPNFVAVDMYAVGALFEAVEELNAAWP